MKELIIATGNFKKYAEYENALNANFDIKQEKVDLLEIQGTPEEIVKFKAKNAFAKVGKPCIVEDVSFEIEDWGNLPGPYIKYFIHDMGIEKLAKLSLGSKVVARVLIGIAFSKDDIHIVIGEAHGTIVNPRVSNKFGFDLVFLPNGHDRTFSEMTIDEKNAISHRGNAIRKLVEFLKDRN